MNSLTIIISLVVLGLLIYLIKYKRENTIIKSFYLQTFLIIVISGCLILNIIYFKNDTTSIVKIIILSLVLIFSVPKYIKKLQSKIKSK